MLCGYPPYLITGGGDAILQAVAATINVERGNVHLTKAIAINSSARWYLVAFLLAASFGILFLDWYSS